MTEWNDESGKFSLEYNSNKDVEDYSYLLKDLTYSSKPLMNVFTLCLRDIRPASFPRIAQLILEHFQSPDNGHKLPTLHLIDSICKTLGPPWIELFLEFHLERAFVQAYLSLTSVEHKKEMQRTFLTWTTNLFPNEFLSYINTSLSSKRKTAIPMESPTESTSGITRRKHPTAEQDNYAGEIALESTNNKKLKLPRQAKTMTVTTDAKARISAGGESPEPHVTSPLLDTVELSKILSSIKVVTIENKLYGMPKQCANCGLRFPDTERGRQAQRLHLDGHYRRKARFRQRTKRVLARDWFPPGELWFQSSFLGGETLGEQEHGDKSAYFTTPKTAIKPELEAEEDSEQVPAGENPQNTICAVCSEALQAVWDDEAGGWFFKASRLDSNGNPCHSTCLM